MNTFKKSLLGLALGAAAVFAFSQGADPVAILKAINDDYNTKITNARQSGPFNQNVLNGLIDERTAKAKDAVKGVDPNKIDAKQGYAWAQLFQMAGLHREACTSAQAFLNTKPAEKEAYSARNLMLTSCNTLGEADMLINLIGEIKPTTEMEALNIILGICYNYADTINGKKGMGATLEVLNKAESMMPAVATLPENLKAMHGQAVSALAETRSDVYLESGMKTEAVASLDKSIAALPANSPALRSLNAAKKRAEMFYAAAPALPVERGYGEFKGLESLKGKVVILDFFAHWCGPCIASFPDMKKLYADHKADGLEIIGVTTYYGYYKTENREKRDMAKDVEFAKMGEFIKEHDLPWPVMYGERANFEAYGVTGIPHVTVLDKAGKVHKIKIGYSAKTFADFRASIEKLLKN